MSKLIVGKITVKDLRLVIQAAQLLGWTVQQDAAVRYYMGAGPVCDLTLTPQGERNAHGEEIGRKYSIGFRQRAGEAVEVLYDNAMNGREVMARGKEDSTTTRLLGKFQQAYNQATYERVLQEERREYRVERQEDGRVVLRVRV